ncbi:hypothetical protein ANCDUO_16456, partial [Ancylostoma duodenale]
VSYYSPDNANPYTYWTPSKLSAAAGWVMRAEEVAVLTNTRGREQGEHTAWMERLCRLFAKQIIIP